ncbi:hypothetical protein [Methylacidimicrobium tartarophylax]|uniref:hypothetical protein n=1 Tax=Methylacidimicrobium tartarophylax TaxID=1041768 RepID=UPI001156E937|nr:hypothetical protein [Methylacidimicrobium tartarophylax]
MSRLLLIRQESRIIEEMFFGLQAECDVEIPMPLLLLLKQPYIQPNEFRVFGSRKLCARSRSV